jgi:hypothetical protein
MQRDKLFSFYIPVRLLGLAIQIRQVCQLLIQHFDHLFAGFGRQIIMGFEHF